MSKIRISVQNTLPGDVFHPGEFLLDELKARNLKQGALACEIGMSKSEMSLIINGKRNINIHTAVMLEEALGIDAETWMGLQIRYDINKLKEKLSNSISNEKLSVSKKKRIKKIVVDA